ncbi:precorrin-3B C(17)-methyltransferase [Nisaea acidiphila]|uniref:Precorrin-3B C(17)-methyltransferase n=1 Tax=Nisaea acidiphila TaxID=1862145 RepID=A0A9J7AN16_9PROT|nr:precorrin-3B C(17)-methyltransferase [Nisaea acidiphila]UUX48346.1 precorrin-3B C(17)-methyltransferase [Nisaea acidiphila]
MSVVVLSPSGFATGRKLAEGLGQELQARSAPADTVFADTAGHLRGLFTAGEPILFVGAAGALIRLLAPLLSDKTSEPPVLAIAEDGSAVIPLLGGHRGANDLAREAAAALGGIAAITTASDLALGVALDAPPAGWHLAPESDYKSATAALLRGEAAMIDPALDWLAENDLPSDAEAELKLSASIQRAEPAPDTLTYHPERLAIGVGCERDAEPEELIRLVEETLADAGLAPEAVAGIFSIDVKMDEAAVHALGAHCGRPVRFFDAARLEEETPRLATPSEIVFKEVGCHGVSEGAALAAAGPDAALIVPKLKSKRATCAIAEAPAIIDGKATGTARGRLALVGIGPGAADWRTPEASAAIRSAEVIVGYGLYIDLLGPLAAGKERHDFALGEEEKRAAYALDLAAEGKSVALVSSGDIGIYAMATLVYELLDKAGRKDWERLEVFVTPGISALQACAARIGAPLGHDFCTISLSDLLTPWDAIQTRVKAAAEGDFVISFYNPVSMRRRTQLAHAREVLLQHRPPETPVILGRSLGRPDETVTVTTLQALSVDQVDMMTLVMVGSSETRFTGKHVYTPRGYAGKAGTSIRADDKKDEAAE